jgi:hypothetical protein
MDRLERLLTGSSPLARGNRFVFFCVLFAVYDATILRRQRHAPHGASLVNYIVRDGREDESAMYLPAVRELVDGNYTSTDPYLKEHRNDPDIRPRAPAWIGWLCSLLGAAIRPIVGGSTNATVLLMHVLPPAVGVMLLVRLSRTMLGSHAAFFVSLLAIGGVCYQVNYYVVALHLADLGGPVAYNPELHLFRPYSIHLEFSRFFSPGVTFIAFALGLLPLAADPDFSRRRTRLLVGATLGLQFYFYPHAALVLSALAATLLAINFVRASRQRGDRLTAAAALLRTSATIALAAAIVLIPYAVQAYHFQRFENAADVMSRVGFYDERIDTQRTPVLCWLALAVLLKRSANRAAGRRAGDCVDTPVDRFWTAAVVASVATAWLPGLFAAYGLFPQPWLIPLRCLCYVVPLLGASPALERLRYATAVCPRRQRVVGWAGLAAGFGYAALLINGEHAAGRNNAHLFATSQAIAQGLETVSAHTPSDATILTDDLRLTMALVGETDRYAYIGYGSVSNASNREMLERLMIPCVMQAMPFREFYEEHFVRGFGLPDGPSGEHWALHHGSSVLKVTPAELLRMYDELAARAPAALLARYPIDFVYLPPDRLDGRFRALLLPTADPWLLKNAAR